jgi:hypothetical protein
VSTAVARASRFKHFVGFGPAAVPIVVLFGIAYLMVSTPNLFGLAANWRPFGQDWLHHALMWLGASASSWAARINDPSFEAMRVRRDTLEVALVLTLLLVPASAVRALVVGRVQPFLVTTLGLAGGIIAVPAITWISETAVVVWRVGLWALDLVLKLAGWLTPVVVGLFIAGAVAVAGFGIYWLVRRTWSRSDVTVVAAIAGCAAVSYALHHFGVIAGFTTWLSHTYAHYLEPVVHVIVAVLLLLILGLIGLGLVVALFGQVGRTVWLSVAASFGAGREQGKCADVAVGTGFAMSLVFCGAVTDSAFNRTFAGAWHSSRFLKHLPYPLHGYRSLLPSSAKPFLLRLFTHYSPMVDLALVVLTAAVALLLLMFDRRKWTNDRSGGRVLVPVMIVLGVAVAAAIPALLISYALAADDSS